MRGQRADPRWAQLPPCGVLLAKLLLSLLHAGVSPSPVISQSPVARPSPSPVVRLRGPCTGSRMDHGTTSPGQCKAAQPSLHLDACCFSLGHPIGCLQA